MTDEHFSLSPSAPPPPTEADYEAIAAAVMETVRGRWFLAEFAKRNRNADSALILERFDRIEQLVREQPAVSPAERVRIDLVEMAKAIAQTRSEIAAIKPDGDAKGTLSEASEELDSIVRTTERATSEILAAAEQIQETAWTLRERGTDGAICDALDQRATDIYSACSFQDLTGQRIRKVVEVLAFLEDRIRAMIEIWGGAVREQDGAPATVVAPHVGEDRTVPHLAQQDIDRMMPSAQPDARLATARQNGHDAAAAAGGSAVVAGGFTSAAPSPARGGVGHPVMAAASVMTPAMAVVGATALALDLTPIETACQAENSPQPQGEAQVGPEVEAKLQPEAEPQVEVEAEPQVEPEAELQVEPEAAAEAKPEPQPEPAPETASRSEPLMRVEARPEATPQPAPPPEPIPEPAAEIDADAASPEPRADPAAVLKRILAIIRAPNDPVTGSVAAPDAPAPSAAAPPAEPVVAPETEAAATAAAVSILAPAVADIAAADGSVADVVAVEHAPAPAGDVAAQPGEPADVRAAKSVVEDTADDILMPLPGPLTVDQAVDAMLRAPGRVDVAATPAAPLEAPELVARQSAPAADAELRQPFVLAVPEFTVATPAPVEPAGPAPQPALLVEPAAAASAEPAAPEPPATELPPAPAVAEATAPSSPRPDEPPVEPVAAVPAPLVAPAPPAIAASEPPAVAPPTPAAPEPAHPTPRYPGLAAITALSDEEKIALFS